MKKKETTPVKATGLNRRQLIVSAGALAVTPLAATAAMAAAPMLGPSQPAHYRFKLGSFEVTLLSDAAAFIDGPWPLIGGNAQQTDVDQLMRANLLPPGKYRPGFTPMVVNTGKALILFDTGNGERGFVSRPHGGWLAAQLAPAGFRPEQIDMVVLSHGHPDHIGGLFEGGKPLFPAAQYAIGDVEYGFWTGNKPAGDLEKFSELFRDYVVPIAGKTRFIKPNSEIVPGIRAVKAYGHTPGHLAFDIESDGKRLFFWGDCAHHQVASLARPDWHCVFDVDRAVGAETRGRIFDMVATDRLAVSGFHMPFPSLGFVERRKEGGYRWLPHSYQLEI